MKKILKNAMLLMLVTLLCLSFVGPVNADEPSYTEIAVSPEEPTRLSEVTFTVNITGEDIEEVRIIVEECIEGLCYPDLHNESMENTQGNDWEGTATLVHDDATYGTCWLVIKSNGTWYDFRENRKEFDVLPIEENGQTNGDTNGDGGTDGTPGFELILVVVSIAIILSIYRKKRMR